MSKSDAPLKSAYELAMERLRRQDRDAGVEERRPLTEDQKQRIADVRQRAEAELAQIEIMFRKNSAEAGGDPERLEKLHEQRETDRRRVESQTESRIAAIREDAPRPDDD